MAEQISAGQSKFGKFCLYAILVLSPVLLGSLVIPAYSLMEIIAALMILSILFGMLKGGKIVWKRIPYHIPLVLFLLLVLGQLYLCKFSVFTVIYRKATLTTLWKFAAYVFVFWGTLYYCSTRKSILQLLTIIFMVAFFISLVGILGRLSGSERILWFRDADYPRFFGTFISENHFSAYIGMIIPLFLGALLYHYHVLLVRHSKAGVTPSPWVIIFDSNLIIFLFMGLVFVAALFISLSRAGMSLSALTFFPFLIAVYFKSQTKSKFWLFLSFLALLILFLTWIDIRKSVQEWLTIFPIAEEGSLQHRFFIYKGLLAIIKRYPIFGTGLGSFEFIFPLFRPIEIGSSYSLYGHCEHLQLIQESGVTGYLIMIVLFVIFLWKNKRLIAERKNPLVKYIGLGTFMSVIFIFFYCLFDFSLRIPANMILLSVIVALNFIIVSHGVDETSFNIKERVFVVPRFLERLAGFIVILLFLGFVLYPVKMLLAYRFVGDPHPHGRFLFFKNSESVTENNLKRAIFIDPSDADYHYLLALTLGKKVISDKNKMHRGVLRKDLEPVFQELSRAIELYPYAGRYYFLEGVLCYQIMDTENGRRALEKSVELAPVSPHRHMQFALFYFNRALTEQPFDISKSSYFREGIERYKKAVLINPARTLSYYKDWLRNYPAVEEAVQLAMAQDMGFQKERMLYFLFYALRQSKRDHTPLSESWNLKNAYEIYKRLIQANPEFDLEKALTGSGGGDRKKVFKPEDIKRIQLAFNEIALKESSAVQSSKEKK